MNALHGAKVWETVPLEPGSVSDLAQACAPRRGEAARLRVDGPALLEAFAELGAVRVEVGNRAALLGVRGAFATPTIFGQRARVTAGIDLRAHLGQWRFAFALRPHRAAGALQVAVFNGRGERLLRVTQVAKASLGAWEAMIGRLTCPGAGPLLLEGPRLAPPELADQEVDVGLLRREWAALRDLQDFVPLLRRLDLGHEQALRLVGPEFARPAPIAALGAALAEASASGREVSVQLGNPSVVQTWRGVLGMVRFTAGGVEARGSNARLRVRLTEVGRAWWVLRPTRTGQKRALELFDRRGLLQAQVVCGEES